MGEVSTRIKTCYISAPPGANLINIREALDERGVRVLVPEAVDPSMGLQTGVQSLLEEVDLVIGVLTRERRSQWVLFELGQAIALKKQIVIFAPPKGDVLPYDLQRFLTLRISLKNREAIDFALDQIFAAPERKTKTAESRPSEGRVLGAQADDFLIRMHHAIDRVDYRRLEALVTEAVLQSGVEVLAEGPRPEHGFDLAIWSDALQPFVGNPLLIEIKADLRNPASARDALRYCTTAARAAGSNWSLLLYGNGPGSWDRSWASTAPTVLVASLDDLIEGMRTRPFVEIVRDLRNRRIHGGLI